MLVGVPDKIIQKWLGKKKYIIATDEGEAVGIAAGYYIATGKRPTVFMSADGFCNALNPITSLVIPEEMEMDIVIGTGRKESQHWVMTSILKDLIKLLPYDSKRLHIKLIEKE